MTMPDHTSPEDILVRAGDALRQAPVPEGPSDEVVARILSDLRAAEGALPLVRPWRRAACWATRSAAAFVLAAGLCYIAGVWVTRPAAAFAVAAQKFRNARTLSYRTTTQIAGRPESVVSRVLVKAPAMIRCETEPDGPVTLFDATCNRTLVLNPASRSALLMEGPAPAGQGATNMAAKEVEGLRKPAEAKSEPVGRRRFGAVVAEGFRVRQAWQELVVGVDPVAKLPLRIDTRGRINDMEITGSVDDFQIDPRLDNALFRFEPPAGYALSEGRNAAMGEDEAIADLFRNYAEHAGGTFPARLDDWAGYAKRVLGEKRRDAIDPEAVRLVQTVARVQVFLLDRKGDYGYRPEGIKLGDADKVLFWFRRKGFDGYRAIYGDLHWADVTAEQLPSSTGPPTRPEARELR